MKAYLTRRYRLSASHRLYIGALSDEENRALYGKCNNPHGHGHNYAVEVTVSGNVDSRTGMVCNLADLDQTVNEAIVERFDHQNLNCMPEFAGLVPTTENLAITVFDLLKRGINYAHLEKVRIEETANNSFEYSGGPEPLR
jgi:6-pyruvoyltetrahydropterin/6-carboxytetrahydropterin synthase